MSYIKGNILIRPMQATDWGIVQDIYAQGIATGVATLQRDVPNWDIWNQQRLKNIRFVAEISGTIVG